MEVLADLAALALERAELLDREGRRGREELRLKRAAEDISGSLELEEVYRRILRHAVVTTGAPKAAITRVNARAGELTVAASVDFSSGFARRRHGFHDGMLGSVARSRTPYRSRAEDAQRWTRAPWRARASARSCTCRSCWARACSGCSPWPARAWTASAMPTSSGW